MKWVRLIPLLLLVSSQNIDFAKFFPDAVKLLQTAISSFSTFKPNDWIKLFQAFMDKDDQKVVIEILEGIAQGGDTKEALFKFAGTKAGEILFEKLEPLVMDSLEMKEKYFDSFTDFQEKAAIRKAKKKKRNMAKKGVKKKRKPQEQKKQQKKPQKKTTETN